MRAPPKNLSPAWKMAKGFFAFLFFAFLLYAFSGFHKKPVGQMQFERSTQYVDAKNQILVGPQSENQELPVRLQIPKIHVDAAIQYVGVTSAGAMAVPSNSTDVGWFNLGPVPGENGSAVIAGHFNGERGEAGVFSHLDKLKEGDMVYVQDTAGGTTRFVVRSIHNYDPGYANDVFKESDTAHLNLITCSGGWNTDDKEFNKRLVVFADMVQ